MTQSRASTNPFILLLIVLLGSMVGYFWYTQQSGDEALPLPAAINDASYLKFKEMRFDLAMFQQSQFQTLKIFGEYPIKPGATGKLDLFSF
ncbi:MAG: hypothetical protein Q7R83_00490 [bacterium]|nr:hypothetical protein [bacterium]